MNSKIDIKNAYIELGYLDVILLIITFVITGMTCCYCGAKCSQNECRCNICKGLIKIESAIASGRFGSVYKISETDPYSQKTTSDKYVIKTVEVDNITEAEECQKEANQLRQLSHKNIVKFKGDFIHIEYNKFFGCRYNHVIEMEFAENGDLIELLDKHNRENKLVKETRIMNILEQLCEAISYIHKQNIVHRDIKCANILICKDNTLRLTDFGLSDKIRNVRNRKVGTRSYMAPEEFKDFYKGPTRYDYSLEDKKAADMWCVGCVLYELCTGKLLVYNDFVLGKEVAKNPQFVNNIMEKIPSCYSKALRTIIKRLLSADPNKRPRADDLLKKNAVKRFHKLSPYKLAKEDLEDRRSEYAESVCSSQMDGASTSYNN